MLKQLQMGLRAFMLLASKVWSCVCYMFKKQYRAVIMSLCCNVVFYCIYVGVCTFTWFRFSWLSTNLSSMKCTLCLQYLDIG